MKFNFSVSYSLKHKYKIARARWTVNNTIIIIAVRAFTIVFDTTSGHCLCLLAQVTHRLQWLHTCNFLLLKIDKRVSVMASWCLVCSLTLVSYSCKRKCVRQYFIQYIWGLKEKALGCRLFLYFYYWYGFMGFIAYYFSCFDWSSM